MGTFFINCTTCQTRLKVRDERVIGQILACPKCNAMVLVQEPQDEEVAADDLPDTKPMSDEMSGPLLPNEQWLSGGAAASRRRLLLIVGLASAVMLTVIMVIVFSRSPAKVAVAPESGMNVPDEPQAQAEDSDGTSDPPAEADPDADPDAAPGDGPSGDPAGPAATTNPDGPATGDPDSNVTEAAENTSPDDIPPGLTPAPESGTPNLDQLENLLNGNPAAAGETSPPDPDAGTTETEATEGGAPIRPEPIVVDVEARMKRRISGIEFENVALSDFVEFMIDFSTVPIAVDLDALAAGGFHYESPISVVLEDTPMRQLIEQAVRPLGLEVQPSEAAVQVTWPASAPTSPISLPIDDLSDAGEAVRRCAQMIASAEGDASNALQANDQSLTFSRSPRETFHVRLLLDAIRQARGLALRTGIDPARVQSAVGNSSSAAARPPLSANFSQPARLARIVEFLADESKLAITVDWSALSNAGWHPDCEASIVVDNAAPRDALAQLLLPRGLDLRATGPHSYEVTTPAALDARVELRLFPVKNLLSATVDERYLIERLRGQAGEGSGPLALDYDPVSHCLVAFGSYRAIEQIGTALDGWSRE